MRLWDTPGPGAIPLELSARNTWPLAIAFAIFFVIFTAIEWGAVASLFERPVDDLFDLSVLMFQGWRGTFY